MELNKLNGKTFSFLQSIGVAYLKEKVLCFPLKAVEVGL